LESVGKHLTCSAGRRCRRRQWQHVFGQRSGRRRARRCQHGRCDQRLARCPARGTEEDRKRRQRPRRPRPRNERRNVTSQTRHDSSYRAGRFGPLFSARTYSVPRRAAQGLIGDEARFDFARGSLVLGVGLHFASPKRNRRLTWKSASQKFFLCK
jgi:hypothetical protein